MEDETTPAADPPGSPIDLTGSDSGAHREGSPAAELTRAEEMAIEVQDDPPAEHSAPASAARTYEDLARCDRCESRRTPCRERHAGSSSTLR